MASPPLHHLVQRLVQRSRQPARPGAGFTLVELLLIGAVLAGLLGGGGAALVRHQRANSAEQLSDSADMRRARQLLQQEIALAERLSTGGDAPPPACAGLANPLVLIGPNDAWRIVYGLSRQGPEAGWRGPAQLQRCGPPHGDAGMAASEPPLRSVVIDRLTADNGFRPTLSGSGVAISLQPHSSTGAIPASTINARLAGAVRFPGCRGLCEETDSTNHWRPIGGDIAGDASKTDVVHFPFDRASYELSEPCDRSLCTVTGIPTAVIANGDLLMFSDQELPLR
jgi:type II secretory pathway pseudopilin PulG